jgi:type I restriction enzyme S subunit
MMKYHSYKDSGIDWLGEKHPIPKHWSVKRVKDLGNYQSGSFIDASEMDIENPYPVYGGNGIRGLAKKYNHNGDYILIGRQGALCGNINYASGKFWATEHAVVVYKKKEYNLTWLGELFRVMNFNQYSLSAAQPGLSVDRIKRLELPIPSVEEQTAIANYLDTKTQAIDKKVSLLEKKIGYYQELRKSLINETVTKGLDINVKLKDSGIDWIGQIPEHWEVKRFKSFASTSKGKNIETLDLPFDNALPLLSLEYLRNENVKFDTYAYSPDRNMLASEKDLIIVWDGAAVGEILKAKTGFISSTIAKINFTKSVSSRFFYFLKDSLEYTLKSIPTGMGIPHLNPTILSNYPCPIPPLHEQIEIAEYLENKVGLIEKIITNIQAQITTLKELRKTLINDVVTGKIKVNNE